MIPFTAAVLAGGDGRRIGQDKAFLPIGGKPSLERVVRTLRPLTDRLLIVTSSDERRAKLAEFTAPLAPNARIVTDLFPNTGTLGGIFTSLQYACSPLCLVVGCDMPFLNPNVIELIVSEASSYQAVVPYVGGYPQPLHAVYHRDCLGAIEASLRLGRLHATSFLEEVRLRIIEEAEILPLDPQLLSFSNVNTIDDWKTLDLLARTSPS
jgi:molybdopterin-guanine dinucleotide biosynthesis protein A